MTDQLFDTVRLNQQAQNALLDIRYAAEAGGFFDGQRYSMSVLRTLLKEGLVEHEAGARWWITEKGRTCSLRTA